MFADALKQTHVLSMWLIGALFNGANDVTRSDKSFSVFCYLECLMLHSGKGKCQ